MEFLQFLKDLSLTLLSVWFVLSAHLLLKQRLKIAAYRHYIEQSGLLKEFDDSYG